MEIHSIINVFKNRKPSILSEDEFIKSAVLIPLVEVENETHILFEVRSMQLKSQPGDICFPGGRIDKEDESPMHGAIRETIEELGICRTNIKDVLPFDYIVSDSGRMIYPFIGTIQAPETISPNKSEVEEVFTVPLNYLLQTKPKSYKINFQVVPEDDFPFDLIIGGENYQWKTRHKKELFYQYDGKVIWGLTAKILHHFLRLLKEK